MCPIEYAFGLFNEKNTMDGCITFGTPVSGNLRDLWQNKYKLMELNRLVVNENLPKNTLSFFVSQSVKMLAFPLVLVSYADTSKNHHGYIYQATNWIYTGLSAKRTDWHIEGMEHLHGATIADISRGRDDRVGYMKMTFGEKFKLVDRPRKHRYFMFLGNKKEKAEMLKMLPYKIEPYPKGNNTRYDASYIPISQLSIF